MYRYEAGGYAVCDAERAQEDPNAALRHRDSAYVSDWTCES